MDLFYFEREHQARGLTRLAGVDEAGRGPLAGPVVAAAVVLPVEWAMEGVPGKPLIRAESAPPSPRRQTARDGLTCPKCDQGQIIEGQRGFGCNHYREGCDFVVWKELAGKKLTEKQIQTLIARGKTGLIKGFKSRTGGKFDARLKFDERWKAAFDFAG